MVLDLHFGHTYALACVNLKQLGNPDVGFVKSHIEASTLEYPFYVFISFIFFCPEFIVFRPQHKDIEQPEQQFAASGEVCMTVTDKITKNPSKSPSRYMLTQIKKKVGRQSMKDEQEKKEKP
jgi:hypothetical protein